jgi:hypothetical protein
MEISALGFGGMMYFNYFKIIKTIMLLRSIKEVLERVHTNSLLQDLPNMQKT